MVVNDNAIFTDVARYIGEQGHRVNIYSEGEFVERGVEERHIFTMMRSDAAVKRLQQLEAQGVTAVNSAFGIENCHRAAMTDIFQFRGIPAPESMLTRTNLRLSEDSMANGFRRCWVKRADSQPTGKGDVLFADSLGRLNEILADFEARGVGEVVLNEHLEGDLMKFYGVHGSDFFYHFYPSVTTHSKFGLEAINGEAKGIPFNEDALRAICNSAAEALKVEVYGGDCIVAPDGTIRIIDFNDWPSFSPCRKEAAIAIGNAILKTI
jgi:glutathione synthase/RimK-type ligase-like ATP-grasp enzyme